ncbi:MAG: hypothetical protein QNJ46_02430 [Leptolyngbyaceae cyanobacterium MO_188.B28]|nr:hypothetical protein [Leptolyngbyaceae cyanobacterium MO_188.B28]
MDRFMQRNTLMRRIGQTVRAGLTGFLTLAMVWVGLSCLFEPAAAADPIESETDLIEFSSHSLLDQSPSSEVEDETNDDAPAEESVSVLVNFDAQAPLTAKLDLQVVDAIKVQTEKALQLVEVNAKEVFVQAKGMAEKATSQAEVAFDEFVDWLKAFSS